MKAIIAAVGAALHALLFVVGFVIALRIEQVHRDQLQEGSEELNSYSSLENLNANNTLKKKPITPREKIWLAFKVLCSLFGIFLLDILEHLNGNSTLSEWSWSIFWTLNYSFLSAVLWLYAIWKTESEYLIIQHHGMGTIMTGIWTFNLAGTATCGMVLWGLSSDTDEDTMLYSSNSDTEEDLMKEGKWEAYEFLATIALFLTVFLSIKNWFRSGEEEACQGLRADSMVQSTLGANQKNQKSSADACCATERGERKSVIFREEMNECFRLGGSKSGDLTASFSNEEAD